VLDFGSYLSVKGGTCKKGLGVNQTLRVCLRATGQRTLTLGESLPEGDAEVTPAASRRTLFDECIRRVRVEKG